MTIKTYSYNSEEYKQELQLRNKELRIPLGLDLFKEDLSQDADDIHIGAFDGEVLIGLILLTPIDEKTMKMRQVAVDKRYRDKGIGRRMVEFAEEIAVARGCNVITMHARKTAVGFYKKLGYEVAGDEFTEVTIPHYKMQKRVMKDLKNYYRS